MPAFDSSPPAPPWSFASDSNHVPSEPLIQTSQHTLLLLPEVKPMLESIFTHVEQATRRVYIETYIYQHGKLGESFADALARAAGRGVDVRLLYDPLGSQKTTPRLFEDLRARGVRVRAYRPLALVLKEKEAFPRDHSRIMVVDEHAYTGGAAWADQWLPQDWGGQGWHDVCVQVQGPCVEDFARLFLSRWQEASQPSDQPIDLHTGARYSDLELVGDSRAQTDLIFQRHRRAIQAARHRLWLEHSYFYPPEPLARDLMNAARRGVDVQVIVSGQTDLGIMQRAARSGYQDWLGAGMRLFEYQRDVLHAKLMLADEAWVTIGTFNCNPTSIAMSNEVNLFVFEKTFVDRVAHLFERDRAQSREVTLREVKARPLWQRTRDQLSAEVIRLLDYIWGSPAKRTSPK